jgi:WD40 repeat protein
VGEWTERWILSFLGSRMDQPQSNLPSRSISRNFSHQTIFDQREYFPQAHDDDIHSAVWQSLENGQFITGSKDNTLKSWTMSEHGKISFDKLLRPSGDYTSWITALTCPSRDQILYGARDGTVALLTESHHRPSIFKFKENYSPSDSGKQGTTKRNGANGTNSRPICKILNQARVTTLCDLNNFDGLSHYALIGKPKEMICLEKHQDCTLTQTWKANIHTNDWVRRNISFPSPDSD